MSVDEVLALTAADEPPRDRDLGEVELTAEAAVCVVEEELHLTVVRRCSDRPAGEQDVVRLLGAERRGLSDPAAQTIASATFDLPEPFGPTTTATPGSSETSTRSGNDLKPRSLIDWRCTSDER